MTEISIRPMTESDTGDCAEIHIQSFQGFFLTFLGYRFVQELYRAIVQDPVGIAFVAVDQGKVVGFSAGATCAANLYRHLIRRRMLRFAWASSGAFLRKPSILPRLLRAFTMTTIKEPVANCGTLMSLGVLPEMQGRGAGKLLVQAFLREAFDRGLENIALTTDRDRNDSANRFYQGLGFSLLRTYVTPEGRWMNEYVIPLRMPEFVGEALPAV